MSEPTLRILSLGAGVQSTTLLLMSCEGILPRVDYAIFADTGWEPRRVYEHLEKITDRAAEAGVPVLRVAYGNLRDDVLQEHSRFLSIPFFVLNADGSRGMGQRQCTPEYKLAPIRRKIRELLGAAPPGFRRVPKGKTAEEWVGFSADEIGRVSDHAPGYIHQRYPLIELGMDRKACQRWLDRRNWMSVEKSACVGCPYHGNRAWRDMRDNHPDEWKDAVEFDRAIRTGGARSLPAGATAYLHASRVPLGQAPIDRVTRREWKDRQGDFLDELAEIAEEGDPDGCSPHRCRSGRPVTGRTA